MNASFDNTIPSWLETPPNSRINPPVQTRSQELPFGELQWGDFERLCLRLARLEANVEHCQLYGLPGDVQKGIDIYARQRFIEKYRVYQCKRVNDFGPSKIKDAVSKFVVGDWLEKTETFVLCTKESLQGQQRADEVEYQNALLKQKGISFQIWDSHLLSLRLKDHPKLIDDFFGRSWVIEFCGEEVSDRLGGRLDSFDIALFREKLKAFYNHVFNRHDPGILIPGAQSPDLLTIEERFVPPDIYDQRFVSIIPHNISRSQYSSSNLESGITEHPTTELPKPAMGSEPSLTAYRQRQFFENWLGASSCSVVLGGPGSGKSTLLRYISIELLSESPKLPLLSQKWGQFLPIWVPFPLWTRQISFPATAQCSLKEVIYCWLKSWDEEQLWPLVQRALEDERLLLLVDGLDEWADESAARIALDRLKVFIEQRNIPAILTSRPHGFYHLGMEGLGWQIGELSELSGVQQKQLALIWFKHRICCLNQYSIPEIEQRALGETEGFITELKRAQYLGDLAKVPLLLCLLIYHRFQHARLPQSRFKAYDSLIDHLISEHPQRRRRAASLAATSSELSDNEIKNIFSYLAHHVHQHHSEGLIDHDIAISLLEDFLKDTVHGYGFGYREARQYSREILEVGENVIGLLVKKSPTEIGFYHRLFQEYLTSYYISRLPLKDQLEIAESKCLDSQWKEIILGLFSLTNRPEDIQEFVQRIQLRIPSANVAERNTIELLLCEIAFGDFNCPVGLSRELAEKSFREVELGMWMPQRERFLELILDGLRSIKMKKLVKSKLTSWFPCRERWRTNIFSQMTSWPKLPEVAECLWKGMHDEDIQNQRAAAKALSELFSDDEEMGGRIASLAYNNINDKIRAVAIEALLHGWPNHGNIERIIIAARDSLSPELRLVSIMGRIQKGLHNEEDRKELINLGTRPGDVGYQWRDEVSLALLKGWPRSSEIKKICFGALGMSGSLGQNFDRQVAIQLLLQGYSQDDEVAQFFIQEIRADRFHYMQRIEAFSLLIHNFLDCPGMKETLNDWIIKENPYLSPEIAIVAKEIRTPTAKDKLLSMVNFSSFPHWPVMALIEGWGMEDAEVAKSLNLLAYGPPADASQIGHLIPSIITDKARCRDRLLDLLMDLESKRPDFVMTGLKDLGNTQGDSEVVDLIINQLLNRLNRETWEYEGVIVHLIDGYSSDPRVRVIAEKELSERRGNYAVIAKAYGHDDYMRQKIMEIACPLPTYLRELIVKRLAEPAGDEPFAISLLKLYDQEADPRVKTQASIGYYTLLKASEQIPDSEIEYLSKSIVCYGPDHEERRQAAFCGLGILGRLDIMVAAKERIGGDRLCAISIANVISLNISLIKYILQNWNWIKTSLREDFWPRISGFPNKDRLSLWDLFCMFADEYPSPRDEALQFLQTRKERNATPNLLRFLGRVRPKSPLLLEYCLNSLCIGEHQKDCSGEEAVTAAELLGNHFGGEADVLHHMVQGGLGKFIYEKIILAISEGWPESRELEQIFEACRDQNRSMQIQTYFNLICRKGSNDIIFDAVIQELTHFRYLPQWIYHSIWRSFVRRLKSDDNLFSILTDRLFNSNIPSEKVTLVKMIMQTKGLSSELKDWCLKELESQVNGTKYPELGFDLSTGELRSVAHSLLEII